jgi:hypothetical protein
VSLIPRCNCASGTKQQQLAALPVHYNAASALLFILFPYFLPFRQRLTACSLPRNQVPEWASSYINYKGLKKLIKAAASNPENADLAGKSPILHWWRALLMSDTRVLLLPRPQPRNRRWILQQEVRRGISPSTTSRKQRA